MVKVCALLCLCVMREERVSENIHVRTVVSTRQKPAKERERVSDVIVGIEVVVSHRSS